MEILLTEDGRIVWATVTGLVDRPLTAEEQINHAAEVNALREEYATNATAYRLKVVLRALVRVINLRLPAAQRITAEELKAAIKEEL